MAACRLCFLGKPMSRDTGMCASIMVIAGPRPRSKSVLLSPSAFFVLSRLQVNNTKSPLPVVTSGVGVAPIYHIDRGSLMLFSHTYQPPLAKTHTWLHAERLLCQM